MNVNEIIKEFIAKEPDRNVTQVFKAGKIYLIIAPHKNVTGIDFSDPQFLYNEETHKHAPFIPSEDLKLYTKLTRNKVYSKE